MYEHKVNKYPPLYQILNVFDVSLYSVPTFNEVIVENLIDGLRSRATTTWFPVKDLIHILSIFWFFVRQLLYAEDMIQYYYLLIQFSLTADDTVMHLPFKFLVAFEAYQTTAFPFTANKTVMTLNLTY